MHYETNLTSALSRSRLISPTSQILHAKSKVIGLIVLEKKILKGVLPYVTETVYIEFQSPTIMSL